MKSITAYRCDHCKRVTVTERAMKAHEARCIRNPETKTCATCEHDNGCRVRPTFEKIMFRCKEWEPAEGCEA